MLADVYWYEEEDSQEKTLNFIAKDQIWDANTRKQLRNKYNIFFMTAGDAVIPVMIVSHEYTKSTGEKQLVYEYVFGGEDDGHIWFTCYGYNGQWKHSVSEHWVDAMLSDLSAARTAVNNWRIFDRQIKCDPKEIIKE